jgi:predicted nucleic acid-binding protein
MFLDSNVIIDHFSGRDNLLEHVPDLTLSISRIVYIELLSYAEYTPEDRIALRDLIEETFEIIDVDSIIADHAIELRVQSGLKLPDAIIVATAIVQGERLYTRDKEIGKKYPLVTWNGED